MARYSWPRAVAAARDTSMVALPSDASVWVCRSPRSCLRSSSPPVASGDASPRSLASRSGTRPATAWLTTVAVVSPTPGQLLPGAGARRGARTRRDWKRGDHVGSCTERPDPVGLGEDALHQVGDLTQRRDGIDALAHPSSLMTPRASPHVEGQRLGASPRQQGWPSAWGGVGEPALTGAVTTVAGYGGCLVAGQGGAGTFSNLCLSPPRRPAAPSNA